MQGTSHFRQGWFTCLADLCAWQALTAVPTFAAAWNSSTENLPVLSTLSRASAWAVGWWKQESEQ